MPNNPVVASYVADFLKIDQLHVYRQLTGLNHEFDMHVFTHHRENEAHFPYHGEVAARVAQAASPLVAALHPQADQAGSRGRCFVGSCAAGCST